MLKELKVNDDYLHFGPTKQGARSTEKMKEQVHETGKQFPWYMMRDISRLSIVAKNFKELLDT